MTKLQYIISKYFRPFKVQVFVYTIINAYLIICLNFFVSKSQK